ncbi:MAG: Sir2 family NAD-dependent protein deacetylase [Desulfobacterales bacterium]
MDAELKQVLTDFASSGGRITVLSGAGISAESGIPTFRGPEGYWTVGAAEYHPQEMATLRMFRHTPEEVWAWYLYRLGVCRAASPNPGHHALVQIERLFGERFTLITQNVDGLHLRAGSSPARTLQIHGNVFFMRCAGGCGNDALPIPAAVPGKARGEKLTAADRELLRCPKCGGLARPHVLWFDEYYDEASYRFESALRVAGETDLLITVGASGSTNLPNQVALVVRRGGGILVDVNVEENHFSRLALSGGRGFFCRGVSGYVLPAVAEVLQAGAHGADPVLAPPPLG